MKVYVIESLKKKTPTELDIEKEYTSYLTKEVIKSLEELENLHINKVNDLVVIKNYQDILEEILEGNYKILDFYEEKEKEIKDVKIKMQPRKE